MISRSKLLPAVGLGALLAAVAFTSFKRKNRALATNELLSYQTFANQLSIAEQERFAQIRRAIGQAEQIRGATKQWPTPFSAPGLRWVQRSQGPYVNYLGIPTEPTQFRWLVLLIESASTPLADPPPPNDEEHHTLADGTGLHVSVWSAPNQGPLPEGVLPFPAAEQWIQRLGLPE